MKQHLKQPFPPLAGLKTFLIVWSTQNPAIYINVI